MCPPSIATIAYACDKDQAVVQNYFWSLSTGTTLKMPIFETDERMEPLSLMP